MTGTSKRFQVAVGDAVKLTVDLIRQPNAPLEVLACQTFTIQVCAKDTCNNIVKSFQGLVNFTSTDIYATLPTPITFDKLFNGCTQRTMAFTTAGSQSITATLASNPSINGSLPILVDHNVINKFKITRVGNQLCIYAADKCGNTITSYLGTIDIIDPLTGMPSSYTFTSGDNGVKCFTVSGTGTITVIDHHNCLIRGGGTF